MQTMTDTSVYDCRRLSEYIGQEEIVKDIIPEIQSSIVNKRAPFSVVFLGAPGLGKSTLASVMALDRGVRQIRLQGSKVNDQRIFDHIFRAVIDPRYPDDQRVDCTGYKQVFDPQRGYMTWTGHAERPSQLLLEEWDAVGRKSINQNLQDVVQPDENGHRWYQTNIKGTPADVFTPDCWIVMTTNYPDVLLRYAKALVDRCQQYYFRPYTVDVLSTIITQFARKCGLQISSEAATMLAEFSRGTPRQAKLCFHKARSVLDQFNLRSNKHLTEVTAAMVQQSFENASLDHGGLKPIEQRYMKRLYEANDHTLPLVTLATMLGESTQVVERFIEPDLMRMGLVTRFSGVGRALTRAGIMHMQMQSSQPDSNVATFVVGGRF